MIAIVHVYINFTIGTTTTKGTGLTVTLPVTGARVGYAVTCRAIAGGTAAVLFARATSGSVMTLEALDASLTYLRSTGVTATIPATWATGEEFTLAFTYQAA